MTDGKVFDTNEFYSGGAGIFVQYHDVIKPVYLNVIIKMIITNQTFGLPLNIIQDMSILSLIEWYTKRRFKNPLQCLDFNHQINPVALDNLMRDILKNDPSIYRLAPMLNFGRMLNVYRSQRMTCPIYIYTEEEEPNVKEDCNIIFSGVDHFYLFGDLKDAISRCKQNFTYIFSDIELVKSAAEILIGTCSHILMASDYRYNYIGNYESPKYDLSEIAKSHPYVRIGYSPVVTVRDLVAGLSKYNVRTGGV
ncbi:MAG: hypothetical protein NC548_28350 [Lachnospiraceae bacterium]|nr:hypothetical protein [Lachnospiraceae bacterium]MCM1232001.1 hypothetical protein [Ruminococcus flavefaciens]